MGIKAAAAIGENMELAFNSRPVSRDAALCRNLKEKIGDAPLEVHGHFVSALDQEGLHVVEDLLKQDGWIWLDQMPEEDIDELILYRWNTIYPGDAFFDLDLNSPEWTLLEKTEFKGKVHETITAERYRHEKIR